VRAAFEAPLESEDDIGERMRAVMLSVVGGPGLPRSLAGDIDALITIVNSPLRRATIGRFAAGRRERFYASLRHARDHAPANSTLLGRLREDSIAHAGELDEVEAIEQVPHWMFPFAGSATELLTRTLAMIGSRPDEWRRVEQELATAGDPGDPASIDRLPFVEACILETGRLFPPVTRTFHAAPAGDEFNGVAIPPGTEVVHLFPLIERDALSDPTTDEFRPERWLGAPHTAPRSNLFLSGARECPGRDLILFVIKAAIAAHVAGHQRHVEAGSLTGDPLPYSFPGRSIRLVPGTPTLPARTTAAR
jgi:cytochrome P450